MHIYDVIPGAELTGVARTLIAAEDQPENQFILDRWFPAASVDAIDYSYITGTDRTFTDAMPFRAWDTEAAIGRRPGRSRVTGEIPPLSIKYPLGEYDRIMQRGLAGTELAEALEGDVFNDIGRGVNALRSRMAAAQAQQLVTGSLTLAENGISITVSSGRAAGNSMTVANAWSDATNGTPLTDIITAVEYASNNQGLSASDLVMLANRATIADLSLSTEVRNAAPTLRVQSRLADSQLSEVFTQHGLPAIVEYNAQTASVNGTLSKQIPDGVVVLLPANLAVGETLYGVPAMATEAGINLVRNDRPGPVAYIGREIDPLTIWTIVDAIALPVFKDPNATFVIDVT